MIKILPHEKVDVLGKYRRVIENADIIRFSGRVERIAGTVIESKGPSVRYGDLCKIRLGSGSYLHAEVVGFNKNRILLMPVGDMKGVVPGAEVYAVGEALTIPVGDKLLGRIISGLGVPLDGKGDIISDIHYPVQAKPSNPLRRVAIDTPLSVGVRAIDGMLTVGRGQRIGIFSGSGVGKSTLLGMIARYTDADINVIALIGERGREVKDFVEKELGPRGLERSVLVVATSDQPPMLRLRGALVAHAIAEYFRDQGKAVNLMMDSVTRFAMAQREVGLAAGEPSATRGYPPSVFSLLPQLMERSGTSDTGGSITGFYTVLVEGDDMNEPIADAARGILDGHIVLERRLANAGHYPSIDVLASISRCMKDVVSDDHMAASRGLKELMAAYRENEDMITIGGYARGANATVDRAIMLKEKIDRFLRQDIHEEVPYEKTVEALKSLTAREEKPQVFQPAAPPAFAPVLR